MSSNSNDLKNIIKKENLIFSEEECYCYMKDASNEDWDVLPPNCVVFVETIEDVQKVVRYAYDNEIPIIPRGAGTNMVGACVSNKGGIVLNFSKMNKIIDFNPTNLTITVQPGVVLGELKKIVAEKGLFFPPDPSNYKVSTIGGGLALSSGGAASLKYGTFKNYVLSLKVVTSDGKLMTLGFNTLRDVVGYCLSQLIVGSEGTLAIIVEATLKLIPMPKQQNVILAYFNNLDDAMNTVDKILTSNVFPSTIDFMDKNSIQTVEAYKHCGLKIDSEIALLINLDGEPSIINDEIDVIKGILENGHVTNIRVSQNDMEFEEIWDARRASFSAATRLAPNVATDDFIVPRSKLQEMIEFCQKIMTENDLKMCLVGHIADGNLHPQVALDTQNSQEFEKYKKVKSEMYSKVISLGGSITSEHGIGLEKRDYLAQILDVKALEYMKQIKKMFDPKNILNPDKVFKL